MKKVALVTGGTRGIGEAISRALLDRGYTVVATYRHDEEAAERFMESIDSSQNIILQRSDVCSDADIEQLTSFVSQKFGYLNALINNAGRVLAPADWAQITRATFLETLDTNLVGPALMAQRFSSLLKRVQSGHIINIGSTYGIIGDPYVVAYSAAKAGILQVTRALAKKLAPTINVNAILPGHVDTSMTRSGSEEFISEVIRTTPLQRIGRPDEISELVAYLVSDAAKFITGQAIIIDGGHILR